MNCLLAVKCFLFIVILVISSSCVHRKQTSLITKDAIDVCGCDRSCIIRIINIKGHTELNEKEYKKHCG